MGASQWHARLQGGVQVRCECDKTTTECETGAMRGAMSSAMRSAMEGTTTCHSTYTCIEKVLRLYIIRRIRRVSSGYPTTSNIPDPNTNSILAIPNPDHRMQSKMTSPLEQADENGSTPSSRRLNFLKCRQCRSDKQRVRGLPVKHTQARLNLTMQCVS